MHRDALAKRGITLLLGRQVVMQPLIFVGSVLLARLLTPAEYGLYAIATFLVSAFALVGDFGLAYTLIQRNAEITDTDLQVAFTAQQILTTLVVLGLWLCAGPVASLYPHSPPETVWLVRSLAFTLYLASWRAMSSLQLERRMLFNRLAAIDVIETAIYQSTAIMLALRGLGVWSLVWANLIRSTVATILTYLAAPWRVRFRLDCRAARDLLAGGIPFQGQMLLNSLTGWMTPLVVGTLIGPQAVGYVSWAVTSARKPLVAVDGVMRVAFPHFSRMHGSAEDVERMVVRYLTWLVLLSGMWFVTILVAGSGIVRLVYTSKWLPAVPSLVIYAAATVADVVAWVLCVSLNGLGRVKRTTGVVLARGLLCLTLSVVLVHSIGYNGVPLAYLLAVIVSIPAFAAGFGRGSVRRLLFPVAWVLVPVGASAATGVALSALPVSRLQNGFALGAVTLCTYAGCTWLVSPDWMKRKLLARLPSACLAVGSRA